MNSFTGRIDKVIGTTNDGIDVFESDGQLAFSPVCPCWYGFEFYMSFCIEFNRNELGSRRPYYVLNLFGLKLTGGWLFEYPAEAAQ